MSEYRLSQEIIERSAAKTWDKAKLEWSLERIYESSYKTCLCGHNPISEICVLRNSTNADVVEVGNCCVEKFMEISTNKLFAALKKIAKDIKKAVNAEVIQLAYEQKYISSWDRDFYLDTFRKRKLSAKQQTQRERINGILLTKQKISRK